MRSSAIKAVAALSTIAVLVGCDNIFGVDNYEPPTSVLSGRLLFDGQPIGVRSRALELELWQPGEEWQLKTKIPVKIAPDGSFRSVIFDGSYELNLMAGGPWVDNTTRIPVVVQGETVMDVPVAPYYVIRNEKIVNTGGRIDATFTITGVNTSRALEFAGVYVGTTEFVDRINQVVRFERTPAQLGSLSGPLSLSVTLPANIKETPGPEQRTQVNVRLGVKIAGVQEMLFTKVYEIGI